MGYEISFLALLLALGYMSLTGFSPGGIIVPSYLVLFLHEPQRIAGTLAAAILTLICFRVAERHLILFGRRKFVFILLTAALWTMLWLRLFPAVLPGAVEFRVIGWVIPGLIAYACSKQGIVITAASLITVTMLSYVVGRMLSLVS